MTKDQASHPFCGCLHYGAAALARLVDRQAEAAFAATGLPAPAAFLLMAVALEPGQSSKHFAARMLVTQSTISRAIEKLAQRGLVRREAEGKFVRLWPTQQGLTLVEAVRVAWRDLDARLTAALGREALQHLTAGVYAAVQRLEGGDQS